MQKDRAGEVSVSNRKQLGGLPLMRALVAGIDIGSERHGTPAPYGSGRGNCRLRSAPQELMRMGGWLRERRVESVAMESTEVYGIAPHEVLEGRGWEVLAGGHPATGARAATRRSEPTDCEWIQRLHGCGLLRGSFRPQEAICMLRTLVRDQAALPAECSDWVRRMQKSLDQMNVRVHRAAVSAIEGAAGMAILRAIAGGEREPKQLAKLPDRTAERARKRSPNN